MQTTLLLSLQMIKKKKKQKQKTHENLFERKFMKIFQINKTKTQNSVFYIYIYISPIMNQIC